MASRSLRRARRQQVRHIPRLRRGDPVRRPGTLMARVLGAQVAGLLLAVWCPVPSAAATAANTTVERLRVDALTATWSNPVTLSRVRLFTLDSAQYPAERVGVRDGTVEALVDGTWRPVATIASNTAGVLERTFAPVQATALRLVVTDSNDHTYSRILELEAYSS